MKRTLLLVFGITALYRVQTLPQRARTGQRSRPAFSFQSFDHSTGFPGGESSLLSPSDISSPLAAQLTSSVAGAGGAASPDFQEQPSRGNELHDNVEKLPLYKQSFPGVYVKTHAAEILNKFEPTRQVAHHHGPNYQIPRNIASSSSAQDFAGHDFSSFN